MGIEQLSDAGARSRLSPTAYPLDEAADALRYIAAGHTRGKVVITA